MVSNTILSDQVQTRRISLCKHLIMFQLHTMLLGTESDYKHIEETSDVSCMIIDYTTIVQNTYNLPFQTSDLSSIFIK